MSEDLPAPKMNPELAWASDNLLWDENAVAQEISGWLGRAMVAYYEVGRRLIWAKHVLGHGRFSDWAKTHFGLNDRAAQRFMEVARLFHAHPTAVDTLKTAGMRKLLALSKTNDDLVVDILNGKVDGLEPEAIADKSMSEAELKKRLAALEQRLTAKEQDAASAAEKATKAEEKATQAGAEANRLRGELIAATTVKWTTNEAEVQAAMTKLKTNVTNSIHQSFSVLGAAVSRAKAGELGMGVVAECIATASHLQTLATLQELNLRASIGEPIPSESFQELYGRYGLTLPPLLRPDLEVEPEPPRAPVSSSLVESLRIKLRNASEVGNNHVSIRVEDLTQLLNEVPVLQDSEDDSESDDVLASGWGEKVPKDRGAAPNLRVLTPDAQDDRW